MPHRVAAGGKLLALPRTAEKLLLYRSPGASLYASTEAWLVRPEATENRSIDELRRAAQAGAPGFTAAEGFDTFWYTWVAVNRDTGLLP